MKEPIGFVDLSCKIIARLQYGKKQSMEKSRTCENLPERVKQEIDDDEGQKPFTS